jgi:DNA repair protein RadC
LAADSILKRFHAGKGKEPAAQETIPSSIYHSARCRVCLIKEDEHLPHIRIDTPQKAYQLVKDELESADREMLLSIMLDTKLLLIGIDTVAIGNINSCRATMGEIFKSALLANCPNIIVCHNHPSGDLEPSHSDIAFTAQLVRCGYLMGVHLRDHLVVSGKGFVSMNDRGLINPNDQPI